MDKVVQQGIKDIKYVMHLTKEQTEYIEVILQEVYLNGERAEMIDALARSKRVYMTEEQLIEKAKTDSLIVTNSSTIL